MKKASSAKQEQSKGTAEIRRLRARLAEAQETLKAITTGTVDAIVVQGPKGEQIFSLESAERSYRVLVEAMTEGAATLSERGTVLYCNARLGEMLAYPLSRLMGATLKDFVAPADRSNFEALLSQGRKHESKGEITLTSKAGNSVPTFLSVNTMENGAGDFKRVLCLVATDLTDQKRSQDIVAAERLARSMLEQAAEAIVVCDENEQVIRASEGAKRLTGINPLHQSFGDAFPLLIDAQFLEATLTGSIASLALGGKVLQGVSATLARADGQQRDLLMSAGPILGDRERVLGCMITLTDVSRLKQVEANLKLAITARDEFLQIAAHELRTPITALRLQIQILQRTYSKALSGDIGERVSHKLDATVRQSERLARLVDELLDVSGGTKTQLTENLERFDLASSVRDLVERCREEAERFSCHLEYHAGASLVGQWDRSRVEQMLSNIVSNAIKYGSGKPISVEVDEQADAARIVVRDHGIGIAACNLEKIFKQYGRAVSTEHYGGLGLGLFVAREIVESHGGSISVISEEGKGSAFTVLLPKYSIPRPAKA